MSERSRPSLLDSVRQVHGVGPGRAAALERCGIVTVEDLLCRLPFRYEDRRSIARIIDLHPGRRATVRGRIVASRLRRTRRHLLLEAWIEDDTGRIPIVWFNQPYLKQRLRADMEISLFGPVAADRKRRGAAILLSPQIESIASEKPSPATGVVPVYERLGGVSGKVLRRVIARLLDDLSSGIGEPLPEEVIRRLGVVGREEAFRIVHCPRQDENVDALNAARSPGHLRLILEELFLFQIGLAVRRRRVMADSSGIPFTVDERVRQAVRRVLPFRLTAAQRRVAREIADDMRAPRAMRRLIQGDVGSGKTVMALIAIVVAVENGCQAAFMAPTEVLAEQHYATLRRHLASSDYSLALLSSRVRGQEREALLSSLSDGSTQIIIGTHALIQETVRFQRMGLVVIDEQHRFGVIERDELVRKGWKADLLVMTATPIPRTLALTSFGDLDVSAIDELPPGRSPIRTLHVTAVEQDETFAIVERELAAGRQAYVVCPLIEESDKLEAVRSVHETAERWSAALPHRRTGVLHGQMAGAQKERVMTSFLGGSIDVLVSTTVIEVGIDVSNATLMLIEHAERFGLAQLHQLRGRVGRGQHPSTCILVSHGSLSDEARARIQTMMDTQDGFVIAERDLELRGPGDLVGTRQWGAPRLRVADLARDRELLETARRQAFDYADRIYQDPNARLLREFVLEGGWERQFGLSRSA